MKNAVREAIEEKDSPNELAVGVDGTWQKRGHVSLNGLIAATSVDNGKIVDIATYSKYCRCKDKTNHGTRCSANYQGSSGGMEVQGAIDIFSRSEDLYGVRYTKFLGDGDSKAFKAVAEGLVYGPDYPITKLECVGHIQKRMGTRLKALKLREGKAKLSDGRGLGGKVASQTPLFHFFTNTMEWQYEIILTI